MNIIGPDALVFGVDNVAGCSRYLTDYGLRPVGVTEAGGRFEALDGTAIVLAREDDPSLPAGLGTASRLRKTIYGVADTASLEAIARELGRDRELRKLPDGSIESVDDMGFAIGFQLTVRRPLTPRTEKVNSPGSALQHEVNEVAVNERRPKQSRHSCETKVVTPPFMTTAGQPKPSNGAGFEGLRSKGVTSQSMPAQRSKIVTAFLMG